ncbi:MAG: ATP-dependent nuclease [Candidatus Helarchaeota archaeon]
MKIREIKIENFRGIEDLTLRMDDLTILIGKNGAGKSSVLHALNFFKEQNYNLKIEDYYNKDLTQQIKVSLTFYDLTEREKEKFQNYIQDNELKVIKVAREDAEAENPKTSQKYYGLRRINPDFNEIRQEMKKTPKKQKYNELRQRDIYSSLPDIGRSSADVIEEHLLHWEMEHPENLQLSMDSGQFFGWPGVGAGKLGKYMEFFFIPAVYEYADEEREKKSNYLSELLDLTIRKMQTRSAQFNQFITDTEERYKEFVRQENEEKIRILEEALCNRLKRFAPDCNISIDYEPGKVEFHSTIYKTELEEFGFKGPISYLGHGVQRSFFFTLLQYLGELRTLNKSAPSEEDSENNSSNSEPRDKYLILLIIEEPELYQHPSRIALIRELFKNLTNEHKDSSFHFQIICSSHSPFLANIQDFENIRILTKTKDDDSYKVKVHQTTFEEIARDLQNFYEFDPSIQFTKESMISRLIPIITPEISEGFFADKVVLCEGLEDKAIILSIANVIFEKDFHKLEIAVLPAHGKTNLDRPALIFNKFDIPTYVIFDTDSDKPKDEEIENNMKWNTVLRKIMGDQDVQDAFQQRIDDRWASLDPNMSKVLKNLVGTEFYDETIKRLKSEYSILRNKDFIKNYRIMKRFIKECHSQGKDLSVLKTIIEKILAL